MQTRNLTTKAEGKARGEERGAREASRQQGVGEALLRGLGNQEIGDRRYEIGAGGVVQRKCAACGEEEKVQMKRAPGNARGEMDRVGVQRKCAACEEEEKVQMKANGAVVQREEAREDEEEQVQMKSNDAVVQREEVREDREEQVQTKSKEGVVQREEVGEDKEEEVQMKTNSAVVQREEVGEGEKKKVQMKTNDVVVQREEEEDQKDAIEMAASGAPPAQSEPPREKKDEVVQTKKQSEDGSAKEKVAGKAAPASTANTPAQGAHAAAPTQTSGQGTARASTPATHSPSATPWRSFGAFRPVALRVQRKVAVGDAGDEYEQEADRVADMVLSATSAPYTHVTPSIRPVRGDLGRGSVQGMMNDDGTGGAEAHFESRLSRTRGGGISLPVETRMAMERGFGYDFSPVRVHVGSDADGLNRNINARAFTSGLDIYFASGEYHPGSSEGRRLLAHELTHVVQQSGGSEAGTAVQRVGKYGDCPPLGGTALGKRFEDDLRPVNSATLITQGRVPGGITEITSHDKVGKPDLYMSEPPLTLPGIMGKSTTNEVPEASDYEQMTLGGAKSSGSIKFAPTPSGSGWSGAFPQIIVGDIKPLSFFKTSEVLHQLSNYISGYTDFVNHAVKVFPGLGAPANPGVRMSSLNIPPGYDYDNFDTEIKKPAPSTPSFIAGNKRYWLALNSSEGVVYYFCLTHPFKAGSYSKDLLEAFEALLPLKKSLRQRHSQPFHQPKRLSPLPQPSAPRSEEAPGMRHPGTSAPSASTPAREGSHPRPMAKLNGADPGKGPRIQLDKKPGAPKPKIDWDAKRKEWEATRKDWDKKHGKAFLEKKENKPYIERLEVDKKLGSKGINVKPVIASKTDVKELKTIELWSGKSGEQLIFWRAKLGNAFDVVADFLDRIRAKFAGFKDKLGKKLGKMDVSKLSGWKQKFLSVLTTAAKTAFIQLLDSLKNIFVNCLESVANKILEGFGEEIEGVDIVQDAKGLYENVMKFVSKVEREFHDRFAQYDELIETLSDIKRWTSIIGDLVTAGRLIWQGISCLSPPGWGCLWGLAGQFAFSVVLSLLMEIQAFRDEINKSVLGIFGNYVGDRFKALMMWGLKEVGLDKYADPALCAPTEQTGSSGGPGLIGSPFGSGGAVSDAEKMKALRKWEEDNKDMLIKETLEGFKGNHGIEVTQQQLLELLKFLKDSGWKPEDMQKHVTGDSAGEITFDELMARLKKAKDAPKEAEKKDAAKGGGTADKDAPPDPAVAKPPSGGGGDKADGAASAVPVLDADKAKQPNERGNPATQWSIRIDAKGEHTAHKDNLPIKITVWIFKDSVHVLTLTNVSATVKKRTFDPPGSTEQNAKRLKIHYKLTQRISLEPHFPGMSLAGDSENMIYGYIKWK